MDAVVYDKIDKEAEKVREVLYGIYPQETITGADIAYFTDGADDIPVKALTVGIEPVQDLHGYDHPWPAGGGKNLSPISSMDTTDTGYINASSGSVGTVAAGKTYTLSFMNKTPLTNNVIVRLNVNGTWETLTQGSLVANGKTSYTFTPANNGEVGLSATLGQKYSPVFTNIQLEEGSAATDFAPYSNICPISGWTGAKVTRTGKNLCYKAVKGYISPSTEYAIFNTASGTSLIFRCKAGTQYVVSGVDSNRGVYGVFSEEPTSGQRTSVFENLNSIRPFTTPSDGICVIYINADTVDTNTAMVELGSTATDYEPYQGETYDIAFSSESGTVYGGTLNVASGKLVVDRKMIDFDKTSNWIKSSATACDTYVMDSIGSVMSQFDLSKGGESNVAVVSPANVNDAVGVILIKPTQVRFGFAPYGTTTLQDFKNWLDDKAVQLNLYLATPVEYTLTPQEITTLLGVNNIWADTGAVKKLAYRADLGKYISSKITEASANILNA